jgi:hypothetical protein
VLIFELLPFRVTAQSTIMAVEPTSYEATIGGTFQINITVVDVVNLAGWEFKLFYLRAIVNCSSVVEGSLLGGDISKVFNITNNYNSTHGRVLAGCTIAGPGSVNGTGVAATVTFKALAFGNTALSLVDTKMVDGSPPPSQPIPHAASSGTVYVTGTSPDVAVTFVLPLKTIVGKGYTSSTNVTVENQGGFAATFNVTAYADTTTFASANISLTIGSVIVTLTWNTSTFVYANYTIKAIADTVPGETDTADNTYISVIQVHVGVPGDVSGPIQGVYDSMVNMRDISYMILLFNARPDSPSWKPNVDVNNDGVVNMRDISIAIINFNKHE